MQFYLRKIHLGLHMSSCITQPVHAGAPRTPPCDELINLSPLQRFIPGYKLGAMDRSCIQCGCFPFHPGRSFATEMPVSVPPGQLTDVGVAWHCPVVLRCPGSVRPVDPLRPSSLQASRSDEIQVWSVRSVSYKRPHPRSLPVCPRWLHLALSCLRVCRP